MIFPIFGRTTDPIGFLAIDSTINGYCCGGVRMTPDVSPTEVAELAHAMTLKYGFTGLPVGGAKAGIIGNPEMPAEEKRKLLGEFGRGLKPHLKRWHYVPSTDMGTTDADIRHLAECSGIRNPAFARPSTSSAFTGLSVAVAAAEAARFRQMRMPGLTLAIEGFGKVGTAVAKELQAMGVKLVALSTWKGAVYRRDGLDVGRLLKLYGEVGSDVVNVVGEGEKIGKSRLLELDVDILSPCAGPFSINESNAGRIAARIVSPGANLPYSPEIQNALHERGILCIPDFVANAGGVMGASMETAGGDRDFMRQFINTRFARKVADLIKAAHENNVTLDDCARKLALQGFSRAKARGERSRLRARLLASVPILYWSGLIPRPLLRSASARYFERTVLLPGT